MAVDNRLIEVAIEINGVTKRYSGIGIAASGSKFSNANQSQCEVKLYNLDKNTRNYILTETSPLKINRTPRTIRIYAGRESYGTSLIYVGNVVRSVVTQPPDIAVIIRCLTGAFLQRELLQVEEGKQTSLKTIATNIATTLKASLNFEAKDKQIANYSYAGSTIKQVDKLNDLGINAFLDNETLNVANYRTPLSGRARVLNSKTGLIGVPEFTEFGIRVKYLLDNISKIGGLLQVESEVNPATNGNYIIYKLDFDITNRDTPFYYIAEAQRI